MRARLPSGWRVLVAVGLLLAMASCRRDAGPSSAFPLPEGAPVVDVAMVEFAFEHPRDIPAGRVVFRVDNRGTVVHRLSLLRLPEDLPPLEAQLKGTERRAVAPFAGIPDRAPGRSGTFAVDLVPGQRYGFVCFVVDGAGSHALRGMASEFRARGPAPAGPGG